MSAKAHHMMGPLIYEYNFNPNNEFRKKTNRFKLVKISRAVRK